MRERCICGHAADEHEDCQDWCNGVGCPCERFHGQRDVEFEDDAAEFVDEIRFLDDDDTGEFGVVDLDDPALTDEDIEWETP